MRASLPMLVSLFVTVVNLSCTTDSTTDVTVPAPVASVSVEPTNAVVQVGTSTRLSAIARDSSGATLSGPVALWTSSNVGVARVVLTVGDVIGVAPGSAEVFANVEGKSAKATITVTVPPTSTVNVYPGDDIQAMVDAYPVHTQFLIQAGTHRRQSIVPKSGDLFIGEPGAILDGENVTATAFRTFNQRLDSVTIRGLIIEHYVPARQGAAIQVYEDNGPNWVVEQNEVRYNGETGIYVGAGWQLRNNRVHHNGISGVQGYRAHGALIEGNIISYNNTSGADPSTSTGEAGGMKFFDTTDLTFRNNTVIHNTGIGLWCDTDCFRVLYEGNTVSDNTHRGIFHELSYDAVIRNNICERNGTVTIPGWPSAGGIGLGNSQNVEVYGNTVRDNGDGITGLEVPSGSGARGPYIVANLYVHNNTIAMPSGHTGLAQYQAGDSIFTRNNRFANNTYFLTGNSTPFAFANKWLTEAEWRAFGQDTAGTFNR